MLVQLFLKIHIVFGVTWYSVVWYYIKLLKNMWIIYCLRGRDQEKAIYITIKESKFTSSVVGRCVPAIFADIADSISETLVTNDNETIRDKLGNAVNGTFLESATK